MKELIQVWIGAFIILTIYSFLYNDNRIYRIMLNTCIGIGAGYQLIIQWKQFVGPLWWDQMWKGLASTAGTGAMGRIVNCIAQNPGAFAYFVFLGVMGSLWYFQSSRKYMWLSRIVIGLVLGSNAGIIFKQQLLPNVPQMIDSCRPLVAGAPTAVWPNGQPAFGTGAGFDVWQSLSNVIFFVSLATVMVYFFFSFAHSNKSIKTSAGIGRWLLMILFGGFFGNTIMTRMALLLQNIQFLNDQWAPTPVPFLWNIKSGWIGLALVVMGAVTYGAVTLLRSGKPNKPSGPATPEPEDETPAATPV